VDIFQKAVKRKIRFQYNGVLTVEDLYDLRPKSLDELYRELAKNSNEGGEGLLDVSREETDNTLRMELVKAVFEDKAKDAERARKAMSTRAQKEKIREIIAEKQDGALRDKSLEDLRAMLEAEDEE
jgi:hypothetical protein